MEMMKNSDRVDYAFMGGFAGIGCGFVSIPAFMIIGLHPALWFIFAVCVCAPIGAIVGFRHAAALKAWGERQS